MPEPCPDDLRIRAVEKAPAGESRRSVAKELRVATSSVIKWARRYSDTGSAGPSRMGTRRAPKLAGCRAWILERIQACPAITPAGLQDWLGGRGVASSLASIWRFLRVCGPARKKPALVADERDRPGRRRRLPGLCRNPACPDARSRRHRRHGHSGQPQDRCGARRDPGRGRPSSVPSALQPDPDPIEQAFAKLRRFLRKDQPRSRDDPWKNVGSILEKFTPQECSNDLANSAYAAGQT